VTFLYQSAPKKSNKGSL